MSGEARYQAGLHRFALAVAAATGALLFMGGLVTSTGSGLAVPDWPLSFGQVFPNMQGGVLFEHGHLLAASTVGVLTVVLCVWLWRAEPQRWVRRLGVAALIAVVAQGALGGLTVLLGLPILVSVAHAGVAELYFGLAVTIALVTSRSWLEPADPIQDQGNPSLRTLSGVTVAAVYLQILLGALMRHSGAGLAIPDFPLSFGRVVPPITSPLVLYNYAHRAGALIVGICALWTAARILRYGASAALRRPALVLVALLAWQIYLGAMIVWTRKAIVPTTTHLLSGALVLATALVIALQARRLAWLPARGASAPAPTGTAT